MTVPVLAVVGIVEIALGVLAGWSLVLAQEAPATLRRAHVRSPGALHQAHLAALLMGAALTATGLAVNPLPVWTNSTLAIAGLVDPFLFVALAFGVDKHHSTTYRALSTLVFTALSAGFSAAAVIALTR